MKPMSARLLSLAAAVSMLSASAQTVPASAADSASDPGSEASAVRIVGENLVIPESDIKNAGAEGFTAYYRVALENNPGYSNSSIGLHYDNEKLTVATKSSQPTVPNYKCGEASDALVVLPSVNTMEGVVQISTVGLENEKDSGLFAEIEFTLPASAKSGDSFPIRIDVDSITDVAGAAIPYQVVSGSISVSAGETTTAAAAVTTVLTDSTTTFGGQTMTTAPAITTIGGTTSPAGKTTPTSVSGLTTAPAMTTVGGTTSSAGKTTPTSVSGLTTATAMTTVGGTTSSAGKTTPTSVSSLTTAPAITTKGGTTSSAGKTTTTAVGGLTTAPVVTTVLIGGTTTAAASVQTGPAEITKPLNKENYPEMKDDAVNLIAPKLYIRESALRAAGSEGYTVHYPFLVKGNTGFARYGFGLYYDNYNMTAVQKDGAVVYQMGPACSIAKPFVTLNEAAGMVALGAMGVQNETDDGVLITVDFKISADTKAGTEFPMKIVANDFLNIDNQRVAHNEVPGFICITADEDMPQVQTTTAFSSEPPAVTTTTTQKTVTELPPTRENYPEMKDDAANLIASKLHIPEKMLADAGADGLVVPYHILVKGNPGYALGNFSVSYDAKLAPVIKDGKLSYRFGEACDAVSPFVLKNTTNELGVSIFGTENETDDGVLLTVDFRIPADASGGDVFALTLSNISLTDADGQEIAFYAVPGYIEIDSANPETRKISFDAGTGTGTMAPVSGKAGQTYTLPECTFTAPGEKIFGGWEANGEYYEPGDSYTVDKSVTFRAVWILRGDINDDGKVAAYDAQHVLIAYVEDFSGIEPSHNKVQLKAADVDLDGKITTRDTLYALRYYVYTRVSKIDGITWDDVVKKKKT
ncbi:MAG: hypothetical protein IJL32_06935 [Oscillospiraceae bacterium]|nr:hypothetical protein [Oscillospiraceae bacterium]